MYEYRASLVRVVDGDTIDVDVDLGMHVHTRARLRLIGVNTPEIYGVAKDSDQYAEGIKVVDYVEEWFEESGSAFFRIRTEKDKKGKYGRWLAWVYQVVDDEGTKICLNDVLIEHGWGD